MLINIFLIVILIFILFLLFLLTNKETFVDSLKNIDIKEFNRYLDGKKVNDIFSNQFKKIYKEGKLDKFNIPYRLLLLYNLYNKLLKIKYFNHSIFMEIITPFNDNNDEFGYLKSLNFKAALEQIYNKRKSIKFTNNQKNSIESYYLKMVLIDDINEILDRKMYSFSKCEQLINDYLKKNYINKLGTITISRIKTDPDYLWEFSHEDLKLIKKGFNKIPEDACSILDLVINTDNIRSEKIKKLKKCNKNDIKKYFSKFYSLYGIKNKSNLFDDHLISYSKGELEFINDLFVYTNTCEDIKDIKDINIEKELGDRFISLRNKYLRNLKKSIDSKKIKYVKNSNLKKCLNKLKSYIESQYKLNKIPSDLNKFPLEKINSYTRIELEKINGFYDNLENCDYLDKQIIINNIYEIYNNIINSNNQTYGCLHSINKYFYSTFPKKIDITYNKFKSRDYLSKLEIDKLNNILEFIKITPPCLELNNSKTDFNKLNEELIGMYDYNFNKNHILTRDSSVSLKYNRNKYKKQKFENIKSYYPVNDNKVDFSVEFDKLLLDDNFNKGEKKNDYYKYKQNIRKNIKKNNLKKCLNNYFEQYDITETGNIFSPSIEIE